MVWHRYNMLSLFVSTAGSLQGLTLSCLALSLGSLDLSVWRVSLSGGWRVSWSGRRVIYFGIVLGPSFFKSSSLWVLNVQILDLDKYVGYMSWYPWLEKKRSVQWFLFCLTTLLTSHCLKCIFQMKNNFGIRCKFNVCENSFKLKCYMRKHLQERHLIFFVS